MSANWFLIFLTLLVLATLVYLYLMSIRTVKTSAAEQVSVMAQTVELRMELLKQAGEERENLLESARAELSQQTKQLNQHLTDSQQAMTKGLEQAHLISMNGLQASETSMMKMLSSTLAMLGTKDTLAYHQVMGGSLPTTGDGEPYTAVDDTEMERLQKLQDQALDLDAAQVLLENMGVRNDGTGSFS